MKAGSVIRRLSGVSVIIAVVSLPRILVGFFPLSSSGVASDPVSEAAQRPGSAPTSRERAIAAPHALGERRVLAKSSSDRPLDYGGSLRLAATRGAAADVTERERREAAAYEESLRSAAAPRPESDVTVQGRSETRP